MKEPSPPFELLNWQTWFIEMITHEPKTSMNECMQSPTRFPSAKTNVLEYNQLSSSQRMEIYCRDYWCRLTSILSENFPFVLRLVSEKTFYSSIAIPYLKMHPHHDPSLGQLGASLPLWIEKNYRGAEKELICAAGYIDHAYRTIFSLPRLSSGAKDSRSLYLQPFVLLLNTSGDLLLLRENLLKEKPAHWESNPRPRVDDQPHYFMLFRDPQDLLFTQEISHAHFMLLSAFQKGLSYEHTHLFFRNKCHPSLVDLLSIQETLDEWNALELFTDEKYEQA